MALGKSRNEASLDEAAHRKAVNLNRYFFVVGLAGMPICLWGDMRWHSFPWLVGFGISVYFVVSSITDAVMRTRRDVKAWKATNAARGGTDHDTVTAPPVPPPVKPLRRNPYFRAGVMGLPFCVFEWLIKHTPVFLLGGGFFAGLLMATLYNQWSRQRVRDAAIAASKFSSDTTQEWS